MTEKKYRVYRYTNVVNGMKYDGITSQNLKNCAGRYLSHYKENPVFWPDIQKYGKDNFKGEILEEGLTFEEACEREKYWIEHDNCIWPNGYNLESGGTFGHKVHPISVRHLFGEDNGMYGKHHTEEAKNQMREKLSGENSYMYGVPKSDEIRRKISETKKGVSVPNKWKSVKKYTMDMEFVDEYPSISAAAESVKGCISGVSNCLTGIRPSYKKYIWRYAS